MYIKLKPNMSLQMYHKWWPFDSDLNQVTEWSSLLCDCKRCSIVNFTPLTFEFLLSDHILIVWVYVS